jgi:hypothetical protein
LFVKWDFSILNSIDKVVIAPLLPVIVDLPAPVLPPAGGLDRSWSCQPIDRSGVYRRQVGLL